MQLLGTQLIRPQYSALASAGAFLCDSSQSGIISYYMIPTCSMIIMSKQNTMKTTKTYALHLGKGYFIPCPNLEVALTLKAQMKEKHNREIEIVVKH